MFRVPLRFTLHKTLLKRRVTELSNLRGLAQVRAVGKTGPALLVFSHGSGAPSDPKGEGQTLRSLL